MINKQSKGGRYFQLILLILAAGSIFALIYLRKQFQEPILLAFDIDHAQLGSLYSFLGWMFVIGYIPSGWLADRVSSKLLIVISILVTALAGVWFAQLPSYESLRIIFLIWGLSSVLTFWGALMKAVKLLSTPEDEARFFGLLDGGQGIVAAVLGTVAVIIFARFVGDQSTDLIETQAGMRAVIYMYVAILFILAGAIAFFLSDDDKMSVEVVSDTQIKQSKRSSVKDILQNKSVWLLSSIIFTGYTVFWTVFYLSGFLVVNHGVSYVVASVVATAMMWMRPIGGIVGGIIADKVGKSLTLTYAMLITSISLIVLTFIPTGVSIYILGALILLIALMAYSIRGIYWSLLDDCRIPIKTIGVAIGIVSFVGYLPDIILPLVSSSIFTFFDGNDIAANNLYFLISASVGIVGCIISYFFYRTIEKKNRQERLEQA